MLDGENEVSLLNLKSISLCEIDFQYYIIFRTSHVLKAQPINDTSLCSPHNNARSAKNCHPRLCVTVTVLRISLEVGLISFGLVTSDELCPP